MPQLTKDDFEIIWEDDYSFSHAQFYGNEAYPDGEPNTCEVCFIKYNGRIVANLGCIDDADDDYRTEVENELINEAIDFINVEVAKERQEYLDSTERIVKELKNMIDWLWDNPDQLTTDYICWETAKVIKEII